MRVFTLEKSSIPTRLVWHTQHGRCFIVWVSAPLWLRRSDVKWKRSISVSRELTQPRWRRRGRHQVRNEFIFYKRNSRLSRSVRYANGSKTCLSWRRLIPNENTFRRRRRARSFHVVVLQRTAKKCAKIYNAHAKLLFCSLNLLFSDIFVAVVVVVCLSSLLTNWRQFFMRLSCYWSRISS